MKIPLTIHRTRRNRRKRKPLAETNPLLCALGILILFWLSAVFITIGVKQIWP